MTTVRDILSWVNTVAPPSLAESWDHVGLNCGRMDAPVQRVLVALDPFEDACREALEVGAQLLLTHHALLWRPGFITDQDAQGRNTLFLLEHGIAHINAHTNLDYAPGGVNGALAHTLGLTGVTALEEGGLLRMGEIIEQPLSGFLTHVQSALGCPGLRYVDGGRPVRRVCVGGGACAGEMARAAAAGCDTFVTADVKYNQFWEARELGLNLIDGGHFYTERPVCGCLAEKLQQAFPQLSVLVSKKQRDCMEFF